MTVGTGARSRRPETSGRGRGTVRLGLSAAKGTALLVRDAGARWTQDACYRLGSSLAFAGLFSIFPLLLLAITAVGFVLGNDAGVRHKILASVGGSLSPASRTLLDQTLASMQRHRTARGVGTIVGAVTLLLGASGVFAELHYSLNLIWRVRSTPSSGMVRAMLDALRARAFAFVIVLLAAVAILGLFVVSTALASLRATVAELGAGGNLWAGLDVFISIGSLTLLLATVYRLVPDTNVDWRDVLPAALLTAVLFNFVKDVLAWYFAHLASYAAYGAVGAVLGLMIWIYVASVLVLYGAEFSRVYAERFGSLAHRDRRPAVRRPSRRAAD
ncbi:MAG TPA: YihY/virulence factor BrkB family protein [Polyangiaceae bacterium]|nr:YihY/virulence factor BrkB family protein [Polyangiaceae bacterium]